MKELAKNIGCCCIPRVHREKAQAQLINVSKLHATGRWKGAVVAVKVVEHSAFGSDADTAAAEERRVARESLLSTSLSHPSAHRQIALAIGCSMRAFK